jgi:hypothetical protein
MAETEAEKPLRDVMDPDFGRSSVEQAMVGSVEVTRATLRSRALSPLSGARFKCDSIWDLKGLSPTSTN